MTSFAFSSLIHEDLLALSLTLDDSWRAWIETNIERGCSPASIAKVLADNKKLPSKYLPAVRPNITNDDENFVDIDGHVVQVVCTLKSPRVVVFDNLLTQAECDELIALADGRLERGKVVDDKTGNSRLHAHRSSDNAQFTLGEFEVIDRVERRLATLLNWPVENGEGLQVLRYQKGGEYRPHFDYFGDSVGGRKHLEVGGQRVGTCVMYLSDVQAGGGTSFPSVGMEVKPKKGGAVFFADVDEQGDVDKLTLHAGVPVIAGVKFIATKWVRERPYRRES
ncbi:2OG-Fe(II) oxygenase [Moraxella bovis]|uniref:2OG-Fe(II) oxygenase n=1 Tax=Moraxella bovis TaxID=476 RepID=UPI00222683B3|nr:2OG-Fe(II) oxygenase [Moraxella bovis]UYZ70678.1 2OG-Fe(II) oxygenase [Moraxella bovis]UYZ73388.1 2OG-Fe(II) oxygenase [Moraxella bovis]UZA13987.1 2OG-Fe(II) oxygenase [Moraxella bovis]UZA37805.1 2OG-Fe(II) oxygenase [Moraxella bovis]UZA43280.1 2OG-Fe(II) oxygenase [Moraxella bovis]